MSTRMVLQRLGLLVACCTLVVSCASTPAPSKSKKKKKRGSDTELKESKRKKKKKKKVVVAEKPPEDEDKDKDKDDDDDDEDAPPKKPKTQREIKAERDRERKTRLDSERESRKDIDDENKRDAKRTASRDDDEDEDEDDEDDDDGDSKKREAEKKAKAKKEAEAKAKADREAKAEAAREAKAEAARKAKEEREAKAEAARKLKEEREAKAEAAREAKAEAARQAKAKQTKKRNADEDEDEDEEDDEDDEDDEEETPKTAAKSKTKPGDKAKPAGKDKPTSKTKPSSDDEDDDEDDSPPKTASKVAAKTKPADKAKAKPPADEAVIDMTGEEPEAPPPPDAEDEDREPAKEFDESSDDPLAEKRVAAIAVPGVDGEPSETDTGPAVAVAAQTGIHGRPLTLAKGRFEAHGGLRVATVTVRDPVAGTTTSTTSEGLTLGATYGVSDKAQVGFDYTLGLSPGAIKGPFNLHGALSAKRGGKLEVAIAGALVFDFVDIVNSTTMTTTSQTNAGLQLGFWMRYRATPMLSFFTGSPALPTTSPGLSKQALPLPPFAYQVAIGLNNAGTTAIELPLGVSVAPIPNLYAFASINIAHVRIANTQSAFLFGDFVPLVLGGFYSLPKADIGFMFSDDLKQGADYLRFDAMLRYYIR